MLIQDIIGFCFGRSLFIIYRQCVPDLRIGGFLLLEKGYRNMAEHISIAQSVISKDSFIDMPINARGLYFHLCMEASDNGILINPKAITRAVGATIDDLNVLLDNNYIIPFNDGIKIIHWENHKNDNKVSKKRITYSYRKWRESVLKRDKYVCQKCGSSKKLNVHHIKAFSLFPDLREDINNGITLCEKCHKKLHKLERECRYV